MAKKAAKKKSVYTRPKVKAKPKAKKKAKVAKKKVKKFTVSRADQKQANAYATPVHTAASDLETLVAPPEVTETIEAGELTGRDREDESIAEALDEDSEPIPF